MKEILYIDCCIRGEQSRTAKLAEAFFAGLDQEAYHVTTLRLPEVSLSPLSGEFFQARQVLLGQKNLNHPRFLYAHQFAQADMVVIAAPFWDLGFPALLKIYIENISVEGITFGCNEQGCYGICNGSHLIFLTTRGGFYEGTELEQGSRYLAALKDFFGFREYRCVAAEGLDSAGVDGGEILRHACVCAKKLAESLNP